MSEDTMTDLEDRADLETAALRAPELDVEKYMPELAEFDLSEAEKIELLKTLWTIMQSFVELGFTTNICEQIFEDAAPIFNGGAKGVHSPHPITSMEKKPDDAGEEES
jgi:hypothetical protein